MSAEDYRTEVERLLKEASAGATPFEYVVREWTAGRMPRTPEDLLKWGNLLVRGIHRVQRQRVAGETLLGIVLAQTNDLGGISMREIGAALGLSVGKVQRLIDDGRSVLALRQNGGSA